MRDKDRVAVAALEELGLEYLSVPLNPYWKVTRPVFGPPTQRGHWPLPAAIVYDGRSIVRESELILNCSMVVVFAKPEAGSLKPFLEAVGGNVRPIIRGDVKKRRRTGRKIE